MAQTEALFLPEFPVGIEEKPKLVVSIEINYVAQPLGDFKTLWSAGMEEVKSFSTVLGSVLCIYDRQHKDMAQPWSHDCNHMTTDHWKLLPTNLAQIYKCRCTLIYVCMYIFTYSSWVRLAGARLDRFSTSSVQPATRSMQ